MKKVRIGVLWLAGAILLALLQAPNAMAVDAGDLGTAAPGDAMTTVSCWTNRPGTKAVFEILRGGTWKKLDSARVTKGGSCDADSPFRVAFEWSAPQATGKYQLRTRYSGPHTTSVQKTFFRLRVAWPTPDAAGPSASAPSGESGSNGLVGCTYKGKPLYGAVYFTDYKYEADVAVYSTDYKYESDLVVFLTDYKFDADFIVNVTNYKYEAGI